MSSLTDIFTSWWKRCSNIIIVLQGLACAWFYVENSTSETDVIGCWQYLSWWQMQALKTQDEGRVKEQLLKMVHSLFLQVFIIYLPLEDFHNIYFHLEDQTWTPQAQSMLKGSTKWCFPRSTTMMSTSSKGAVSDHYQQVENFLMNPTFTSKGGFRIMLNGIRIYKVIPISSFCLWLSTPLWQTVS